MTTTVAEAPAPVRESPAVRHDRRRALALVACGALLVAAAILALGLGSVRIGPADIGAAILGRPASPGDAVILWDIRLPRVLLAVLVGANTAVAGVLLQTVIGNPLADPGLTGVTSGAAVLVLAILLAAPHLTPLVPVVAFAGGALAATVVHLLAWRRDGLRPLDVILAGVAVNALAGGGIGLLSLRYSDRLPAAIQWMNGSVAAKGMGTVWMVLPYSVVGLVLAALCIPAANVLRLGDAVATSLGVRVTRSRVLITAVAVFLAAVAVAAVGVVGFVGLVVPHAARLLVGSNLAALVPMSVLMGALVFLVSDTVGRTAFAPTEIPAGIVMAFVGAPYFLYLMRARAR